jgi:hypothetical protein
MSSVSAKRKDHGPSWSDDDLHRMLDVISHVLSQDGNGWAKVASLFNLHESTIVARDADSIKRKFISLKNHKKPKGDPDCPQEVFRAKRIQREIDNKLLSSRWMIVKVMVATVKLLGRLAMTAIHRNALPETNRLTAECHWRRMFLKRC